MALFGKKKKQIPSSPPPGEPAQRTVREASLTSGRMASLYRRLYCWIFSVNVTMDVYQIESGTETFGESTLPIRGYYRDLRERFAGSILSDQREHFSTLFSSESIRRAVEEGRTCLTDSFCAEELGAMPVEGEETAKKWYEFRVEWTQDVDVKNIVVVFSVRPIGSDLDTGRMEEAKETLQYAQDGTVDWDLTRALCLRRTEGSMTFEYDTENDRFCLHRTQSDTKGRITERFLATLSSSADVVFSHESVAAITALLRAETDEAASDTVLCRKDGTIGAPFQHYRMTVGAATEQGVRWVVGTMENTEQQLLEQQRNRAYSAAVSRMFEMANVSMYYINTVQGVIQPIEQNETGFHRKGKPESFAQYIKKRIDSGRIAQESQEEYLRWLEGSYLQRKTAQGTYEFEALVKDMSDTDYQWYVEVIMPVEGKPGQYLRWCRNDTLRHQAREVEFENKELAHIGEYNRQMLDSLANLIEFRSVESSEHISRVRQLTKILLEDIKRRSPQYELTDKRINMYVQASVMHDVGKISVPDYILNKQGRFTPEEFEIMKKHTVDGALIVDRLNMPGWEDMKDCIRDVVLHHHERYDGGGYPDNLSGEDIDIGVQVVSLADVYDALVSERCYKKGRSFHEAMDMIISGECGVFNPCLLESLKACEAKLCATYTTDFQ